MGFGVRCSYLFWPLNRGVMLHGKQRDIGATWFFLLAEKEAAAAAASLLPSLGSSFDSAALLLFSVSSSLVSATHVAVCFWFWVRLLDWNISSSNFTRSRGD